MSVRVSVSVGLHMSLVNAYNQGAKPTSSNWKLPLYVYMLYIRIALYDKHNA